MLIMNAFQNCTNTSDLIALYLPQQLYLKPISRLNISLQLPNVKKLGKSVSHWEIMDKIRTLIKPDEFTILTVTKTTVEFVRFEAEIETNGKLEHVVSKINNKMIKLKDFNELMRLRAAEWKSDFPNRRMWDTFFQNAKDMDEMKPGERPDTIHISNLPIKWFLPYHLKADGGDMLPSEKIFYRVFEKFGSIRYVDIPMCDPYRKKMKDHISGIKHGSIDETEFFEGYVQFKDYIGFSKTMDILRDKKLVLKGHDESKEVNIKVDFDKSKHLSDASIRRREIVRDRLVKKVKEKEERDKIELEEKKLKEELERQKEVDLKTQKELRRNLREEKRKVKILKKLEITGTDEINDKIEKEEKKLLRVQRKLEAIRLVEELFKRIKDKNPDSLQRYDDVPNSANDKLKMFKDTSELEVLTQREKLHHALKGRVMLKTILAGKEKTRSYSSSSSDTDLSLDEPHDSGVPKMPVLEKYPELLYDPPWLGFPYQMPPALPGHMFPDFVDPFNPLRGFYRGRGFPRLPMLPGTSRGFNRRRGNYPRNRGGYRGKNRHPAESLIDHDDRVFDKKITHSHSPRRSKNSRSCSRNRSYSRSYSRSRSRSRSRKRRRSRSYSYRTSRSKSRSRRSHSRSYTREKSRSRSRTRSKSRYTPKRKERKSRSREKTKSRGNSRSKERKARSREKSKSKEKSRSKSRDKSVDSSTFISRQEMQEHISERRERSKSWSLPRQNENRKSWSKSPEKDI